MASRRVLLAALAFVATAASTVIADPSSVECVAYRTETVRCYQYAQEQAWSQGRLNACLVSVNMNHPQHSACSEAKVETEPASPSQCAAQCEQQYVQCQSSCQPFDCPEICASDYNNCLNACPNKEAEVEAEVEAEAELLTGVRECVKECKSKGKDAANKCKHEKFAKRAQCYAQVPATVKACETGCTRKPRGESLSSTPARPLLGDCQPCDWIYDACLPACNGMSNCQTKCMRDHFDCRMKTPGC